MEEKIFLKKFPNFVQILEFMSVFYGKTVVFETNFSQKGAGWDLLIFAPHVVQTFPELAKPSDLMPNFVKGLPRKKVRCAYIYDVAYDLSIT